MLIGGVFGMKTLGLTYDCFIERPKEAAGGNPNNGTRKRFAHI